MRVKQTTNYYRSVEGPTDSAHFSRSQTRREQFSIIRKTDNNPNETSTQYAPCTADTILNRVNLKKKKNPFATVKGEKTVGTSTRASEVKHLRYPELPAPGIVRPTKRFGVSEPITTGSVFAARSRTNFGLFRLFRRLNSSRYRSLCVRFFFDFFYCKFYGLGSTHGPDSQSQR